VEEADRFPRDHYIAEINRKFSVEAVEPESAFVPVGSQDLDRIFSVQQERVVNRDNTIQFANRVLQIERARWRGTLANCRVTVCEHLDGSLSAHHGSHLVGRWADPKKRNEIGGGKGLWKRRWLRHLGSRSAGSTFPQPRRRCCFRRFLRRIKIKSGLIAC